MYKVFNINGQLVAECDTLAHARQVNQGLELNQGWIEYTTAPIELYRMIKKGPAVIFKACYGGLLK